MKRKLQTENQFIGSQTLIWKTYTILNPIIDFNGAKREQVIHSPTEDFYMSPKGELIDLLLKSIDDDYK